MSTITRAQKIYLVELLLALDLSVKESQINLMKLQSDIETRKLNEKCKKWLMDI